MNGIPAIRQPQQPLISCIVPVFNGERFLREALDSIFAQTWRPIEVIVVDDGSTDCTAQVIADYPESIVYVKQPNAGPAAARNRGLDLARGEFMAFLDADDLWHPEKLARQIACFTVRPETEMCLTHSRHFWEKDHAEEAQRLSAQNHPWTRDGLGLFCQALLAPRRTFDKVGGFNQSLRRGEDIDWFARTEEQGIVKQVLPEVLVYRRRHGANLTGARDSVWLDVAVARLQRHNTD